MDPCPSCTAAARDVLDLLGAPVDDPELLRRAAALFEDALGCGPLRRQRLAAARQIEALIGDLDPLPGRQSRSLKRAILNESILFAKAARARLDEEPASMAMAMPTPTPGAAPTPAHLATFAAVEAVAEAVGVRPTPDQRVAAAARAARRSPLVALEESARHAADLLRQVDSVLRDDADGGLWPQARRQGLRAAIASALRHLGA